MEKPSSIHPTTFVKTDTNSFKELVQRLTGPRRSSEPETSTTSNPSSPRLTGGVRKPQSSKVNERSRQGHRSKLTIIRPTDVSDFSSFFSPSSKSACDSSDFLLNKEEEERAIQERRFYLHPSPRSTDQAMAATVPELLQLFPDTSSSSSSSFRDDKQDD